MTTTDRRIVVTCQDCAFGFTTHDAVEAFDRMYAHDTETGHVTVKRFGEPTSP